MYIGLTYDLRSEYLAAGLSEDDTAEFDSVETIEAIETALGALGHRTERIGNARQLVRALEAGTRWDLVFNIAEGVRGIGREGQVPAILEVYGIPYTFSDPLVVSLTLHKAMTKRVVRDAGIPTSPFVVVEPDEEVGEIPFAPPYFVKPLAEGTGKGVSPQSIVHRLDDLPAVCARLCAAYGQPVLVERYLPGREFTVGVVGTGRATEVLGTVEVILKDEAEQGVYSYVNKERWKELVEYRPVRPEDEPVVAQVEAIALDSYRVLGCRDAGRVDLRCDEMGAPHFIEVNTLAGIRPGYSDLPIICTHRGIEYVTLIERIVASAMMRVHQ